MSAPSDKPKDEPKGKAATGTGDRVVMASRHPDGTPAQQGDWQFIGDYDGVLEGAKHQHRSIAYASLQVSTDPDVNPSLEDQEKVRDEADRKAEAEVKERHKGAFA